jgi:hypothetical protein
VWLTSGFVSSSPDVDFTSTDSVSCPTCSVTSRRMASPPPSTMSVLIAFLNPVRSTVTVYRPSTSGGEV